MEQFSDINQFETLNLNPCLAIPTKNIIYCHLLLCFHTCISSTTDTYIDFLGKLIIHVFLILSNVCIFSSLLCTKIMLIILWSYIYPNLILDANLSLRHFLVHSFFNKHTQYIHVSNCYLYCKKISYILYVWNLSRTYRASFSFKRK